MKELFIEVRNTQNKYCLININTIVRIEAGEALSSVTTIHVETPVGGCKTYEILRSYITVNQRLRDSIISKESF